MEIDHAVRTVEQCAEIGNADITVATNLQEARLLCGCEETLHRLKMVIHSESFWPSEIFYPAKVREQKERHAQYPATTYNLEPDIKSTPVSYAIFTRQVGSHAAILGQRPSMR